MVSKRAVHTPAYWYADAPAPFGVRVLAAIYGAVSGLRRGAYLKGWLKRRHPGVPVLVVGNITAGGAGKTPLTIALVERLRCEGWNPGVASRGYGREDAGTAVWVDKHTDAAYGGDEPVLIAHRTGAPVRVDQDRGRAAMELVDAGCDLVICDDGLQHYRLARDIEIEVVDGRRRYGNGQLLPAGPLRELPERAARCDFRVVNVGSGVGNGDTGFGEWSMRLLAESADPMLGGRARKLTSFSGQRVHAVAGIGDPERFFSMLRDFGIAVVPHAFADHHQYRAEDFEFGSRELPILMTEKDAVKCAAFADERYFSVPVRAELPEAFWVSLLDRVGAKVRQYREQKPTGKGA